MIKINRLINKKIENLSHITLYKILYLFNKNKIK
jgi:hypothetical protein